MRGDHAVDQAVIAGLGGGEVTVAIHVLVHPFRGLLAVVRVDLIDPASQLEDLARVDLDVARLPFETPED